MNIIKVPRLHLVDSARGFAVLFMVLFHLMFSLHFYYEVEITLLNNEYFKIIANFVRILFLFLVGISTRIIFLNNLNVDVLIKKQAVRLFQISIAAFLVTISTFLFTDLFVYWGVLHLIAFSVLLFTLSISWKYLIIFLISFSYIGLKFDFLLQILGLEAVKYSTLDFFPIFPWILVVVSGYYLFDFLLPLILKLGLKLPTFNFLNLVGRNSLIVYLIHQPIILTLLWLVRKWIL